MAYIGLDLGKRSVEAVRLESADAKPERFSCGTTIAETARLLGWLKADDIVGMEAGTTSFNLAARLAGKVIKVHVLDPRRLAHITSSVKKTDREDARKIAELIACWPATRLPTVHIPDAEEITRRRLQSEHEACTTDRTQMINRLHFIFTQAELTDIKRGNLSSEDARRESVQRLPEKVRPHASRLCRRIDAVEADLAEIEEEMKSQLRENQDFTNLVFSMPGIGVKTAFSWLAYIGDGKRFSEAGKVAAYVGLVPWVANSGGTEHSGRCRKGQNAVKRMFTQAAWSLIRSKQSGPLGIFYARIFNRTGKKKAAVAVARKMVETLWLMLKTGEFYRGGDEKQTNRKLAALGIIL